MGLKDIFHKTSNNIALDKINSSIDLLMDKTLNCFEEDELQKIDIVEMNLFCAVFNAICYMKVKNNGSEDEFVYFSKIFVDRMLNNHFIKHNPNASKKEIKKAAKEGIDLYNNRFIEYMNLLEIELQKPRGSSAFVDLTSAVLRRIFNSTAEDEDIYDLLFMNTIIGHISFFDKLFNK